MSRPARPPVPPSDQEIVAVLQPGPDEIRRARAILEEVDRDPRVGPAEVMRRLRLPPAVLAALDPSGELRRDEGGYASLLAVLLDTIAAGCTVRLVTHAPGPATTSTTSPGATRR